ncbi:MAG: OsmC family protein [Taibaiella sp.]|nr:OsmC family protein [Taibaiella sp.]
MTAKVIYKGDLRTEATHLQSGTRIETDAPTDNKGKGERFSPTDLVATALAACMATTMAIAAQTHEINIDGLECNVQKVMAPNPRRIAEIQIELNFPASKNYTDKQKKILEHAALTCPVHVSLHPDMKKDPSFKWG